MSTVEADTADLRSDHVLVRPAAAVVTRPVVTGGGGAVLVAGDVLITRQHRMPVAGPPPEFLHEVFEEQCDRAPNRLAVDGEDESLTFGELDRRANQLARHLSERGVGAGDRIALLFDRPVDAYVGMLAVSKVHATFVPLDVGFPADRIEYILDDADVHLVLTRRSALERVYGSDRGPDPDETRDVLCVDVESAEIAELSPQRLGLAARRPADPSIEADGALAWIIYTSGSTGRPKGVAVEQRSVTTFLRSASAVYGIRAADRVYQGMTIAFDFSVEEIWVPWAAGATLVPKPAGETLLGADLAEFLVRRRVSALCCVPTLLATLEEDLPQLRFLLVSGEACPQDLIARWYRPGRRFLNVYGPTEATVTATWTELAPEKPVTIGVPLPGYAVVILDPDGAPRALARGEVGEIGIAGVGLARGYINNEEKTSKAFVPDFLGIDGLVANPSGRIYRTGDLGRIDEHGEIQYQGRIDLQVKIRGYRIELTEIESVLLDAPGVAAAVVDTYEPEPGTVELVGYYTVRRDAGDSDPAAILERLRADLPSYMVPAYLERLDAIPMTTSDKADRAHLPPPTTRRSGSASEHVEPASDLERRLATALAEALHVDQVSATAHVFDELGVTSLLAARFTARLRGHDDTASVSIKDVYQNPTVRELATTLAAVAPTTSTGTAVEPAGDAPSEPDPPVRTSNAAYLLTGCLHLLVVLLASSIGGVILVLAYQWVTAATTVVGLAERATAFVFGLFAVTSMLPVAAKWLIIGRWTPREIPLWGPGHFRFWIVRILVGLSPLVLFVGTPLFTFYLRALGAHIGRDVLVLSRSVPVAADLVTIGAGTVIRRDSSFNGYRALPGRLQVGPVTLGSNVLVGERAIIDVGVEMGDDSQLAPSSALRSGTVVPAGESWEGSPAERTDTDRRTVPVLRRRPVRRWLFALGLVALTVVVGTVVFTVLTWALARLPGWMPRLAPAWAMASSTTSAWAELVVVVVAVLALALALFPLGVLVMVAVPRVLAPFVRPHRTYALHGVAHFVQLLISGVTNSQFFMLMLGDSSFVTPYLRALGLRLRPLQQTGSNFGTQLVQDSPRMVRVGTGTMVSDGLTIANAEWSSTSFKVSPITIGARNFLGNNIVWPPGAYVGDNVLVATKALLPVDGSFREDVGLLGSPPFEIPRGRPRDERFAFLDDPAEVRRRLPAKNRHNALSVVTVLLARALQAAITTAAAGVGLVALLRYGAQAARAAGLPTGLVTAFDQNGALIGLALGLPVALVVAVLLSLLFERAASAIGGIRPHQGSIYEPRFWRHERLWKLYVNPIMPGSPVQNVLSRVAGLRVGRRVFDDGCGMPEKALVTIGDDVVLNAGAVVQCHSLEDGLVTRDVTEIGSGSCLGVGAFVHLGVTVGVRTTLEADSFLMKGEQTAPGSTWGGNPAAPSRAGAR